MKKLYTFALVFAAALFTLSCEKEVEQVTVPEEENEEMVRISIRGTLDKEISKTAYDADGKMTWVDGDKVALIVSKGDNYSNQNRNQYTLEAAFGDITEEGRNASFYGMVPYHKDDTKEWLSSGIAVYPVAVSQINSGNYYGAPFIKLPSTVDGLASSIVLIGTVDSDIRSEVTTFNFKTAMAVMKVNITNIPAEATAIRLTTNNNAYPVDGDFVLEKNAGLVTIGIDKYQGYGNGYQSVDISGEGAIASRDFFFNIPVGTYPANTLSFEVRKNDQVLLKKTISKEITFVRNECLTVPALPYHRVNVKGSAAAPKLYTENPYGTIRVNISTTPLTKVNYDSTDWPKGNKFGGNMDGWNLTGLKNKENASILTSSGTNNYYLQYIVCSNADDQPTALTDANVVIFGSVPFRYIAAGDNEYDDPSILFGTYSIETIDYWNNYGTSSMTLVASDDMEKGNVKITNILGHDTALYGTYANGILTVSENQEWYIDGNSSTHRLINNWNGTINSTWNLTIAAADDKDLSLGDSYLVNEWFKEENKSYDNIWKSLEASKN